MRRTAILTLLACCAGCSHNPYPLHYRATEGLKSTESATRFFAEPCTPEELEARTGELLGEGYVIIGTSKFVSRNAYHREIHRQRDSQGAEIILFCDTAGPGAMESYATPDYATYRSGMTRHVAVYFARAQSLDLSPQKNNSVTPDPNSRRHEKSESSGQTALIPSTVRTPRGYGTGFFVSAGMVVTAQHVIARAKSIAIETSEGRFSAEPVLGDEGIDVAVLKIAKAPNIPALSIVPSVNAKVGDPVFTLGYPNVNMQGTEPKYTEGTISSLTGGPGNNPKYFQTSLPIQPGNSGGPLVNENGEVVGLIVSRLHDIAALMATGAVPQNVNYAIKTSFVLPFLEGIGIPSQPPAINNEDHLIDKSVLIEKTKKALVMVLCY